jgi:lysozyme
MEDYKFGIDLSHYQTNINWGKIDEPVLVKGLNRTISFIDIKVSEGSHTQDAMAFRHSVDARYKNIEIGYYHFAHPRTDNVEAEIKNFLAASTPLPSPDRNMTLDLEVTPKMTGEEYVQWIRKFIVGVNQFVNIYGSRSFLDDNLPATHGLGANELWLAEYGVSVDHVNAHLPRGWDSWHYWQWTEKFQHPAIDGYVDSSFGIII